MVVGFGMVGTACAGITDLFGQGGGMEPVQAVSSPREDVPSAVDDRFDDRHPEPLVDPNEVFSGGPPPDGIASIDGPRFAPAREIDFLEDNEPVLSLEVEGEVRAYPIQIMTRHEIVNDTIADIPITVTFCPLCNSALAYDRRADGRVLEFGTSGMLHNSALVMYDRQTESLWDHFTAQAIIGHLTGTELERYPVQTVGWADFRDANRDALVMTRDTGHRVQPGYGHNPYSGYDDINESPFLFRGDDDGRFPPMLRIVAVSDEDLPAELRSGGPPVAVIQEDLVERGVAGLNTGDVTLTAWAEPGAASALERSSIPDGRDVGQTGVFVPEVDGRELTFERDGEVFVDNETGSRWNIFGEAVEGELAGTKLQPVAHLNTFWFAWAAFRPDTDIAPVP